MKPRILDLFCGGGGSGWGYHLAGFEVVGVDKRPRGNYPFEFIRADAFEVMEKFKPDEWAAVHASPPCQRWSRMTSLTGNAELHPGLIHRTRAFFLMYGLPYIIENVERAPLLRPTMLCGTMFDRKFYRHRMFETNFEWHPPTHGDHQWPTAPIGRPATDDEVISAVGNFAGVERVREEFEMPWANRDELREAVPPCYTEYIGRLLQEVL